MSANTFEQVLETALSKAQHHSTIEVERILQRRLGATPVNTTLPFADLWSLADLEVDQVSVLKTAGPEVQRQVAHDLAHARFTEAYAIEKAGMSFAAKMSLLAPSLNEQKLYSLFAAEEARHFDFIDRSLGHPEHLAANPFIDLLNQLIANGDRSELLLLVQVVLEGWGIEHYAKMAHSCQHPEAKAALQGILADEAAHHGSGLSLFNVQALSRAEHDVLVTQLKHFLYLVAVGPVGVVSILEKHLGPFSDAEKQQVLQELNAEAETQRKLKLLKGLLHKAGAHDIIDALEQEQAFSPVL